MILIFTYEKNYIIGINPNLLMFLNIL